MHFEKRREAFEFESQLERLTGRVNSSMTWTQKQAMDVCYVKKDS